MAWLRALVGMHTFFLLGVMLTAALGDLAPAVDKTAFTALSLGFVVVRVDRLIMLLAA